MNRRRLALAVVLLALLAGAGWLWRGPTEPLGAPDVVAANDVRSRAEASWPGLDVADFPPGPDFTILDDDGEVRLARGKPVPSELDGARARAMVLDVRVDGEVVGTAIVADAGIAARAQDQRRTDRVAAGVLLGAAVVLGLWWWHLERTVLGPFARLRRFAADVAAGDLDAPLRMDRSNAFGAFTEAFDLLRSELAEARAAEAAAVRSRKELVAELSHDLRTPIASIVATTELLAVRTSDPAVHERLDVVLAKAHQISDLADDLSAAGADALTSLAVSPRTLTSVEIAELVWAADGARAVVELHIADCLVRADPLRLSQVLDNVLVNAAKYAGTPVRVTGTAEADALRIEITDGGPGVPQAELAAVVGRGVRGSHTQDVPGQGLGLYTAARLLERMDGSLELRDAGPGLAVVLTLPLDR